MEEIDVHSEEPVQEKYNMAITLRILNKLDEIVRWINEHEEET